MILPPTDGVPKELHGKTIAVIFSVTAVGRVSDLRIEPAIENRAFARKIDEIMRGYTFKPARDAAGNKIASVDTIQVTFGGK
jgi:outer membrane biosynthesis protein TonB